MLTAVPLFYTGLITCLNVIASGGGSNLFPPEQFSTFSEAEIQERIKGSKIVIVSEQVRLEIRDNRSWLTAIVYAQCYLDSQGMHAVHVRPHDSGYNSHQVDSFHCSMGHYGLGRRRDSLLHGLPALQRFVKPLYEVYV